MGKSRLGLPLLQRAVRSDTVLIATGKPGVTVKKHNHTFVEEYTGLVGFGLDRQTDEYTITCYVQKFADDELMRVLRARMSDADIEALANMLIKLMKKYVTEEEYHTLFLKDQEENT